MTAATPAALRPPHRGHRRAGRATCHSGRCHLGYLKLLRRQPITRGHSSFWTYFAWRQMWDPSALTDGDIDEIVRSAEQPGGTRAILEMYRARQSDARGAVIAESGHNIALENPAALARAYLDFFADR